MPLAYTSKFISKEAAGLYMKRFFNFAAIIISCVIYQKKRQCLYITVNFSVPSNNLCLRIG